jgi:Flp pilus assembly protein TadB
MALLAAFVLLVVVGVFFRRRRRSKKTPTRAKPASAAQKRRSNVQYSRIDEDAANSPAAGAKQVNYEDEEVDLLDAECGERGLSAEDEELASKDRAHSPPRRASRPLRSSSEEIA